MLIRNEYGLFNPSLWVKISLQFLPSGERTTTLDPKGKLIDRVNIPSANSAHISLRDDTIKCTDWKANTIYCYTLTGQQIWTFKDENVLQVPRGIALDKHKNVYVAGRETHNVEKRNAGPFLLHTRSSLRSMLIHNEIGSFNPSLLAKICLQFLPSGERTTTLCAQRSSVTYCNIGVHILYTVVNI
jgi:hypothetical protein